MFLFHMGTGLTLKQTALGCKGGVCEKHFVPFKKPQAV